MVRVGVLLVGMRKAVCMETVKYFIQQAFRRRLRLQLMAHHANVQVDLQEFKQALLLVHLLDISAVIKTRVIITLLRMALA